MVVGLMLSLAGGLVRGGEEAVGTEGQPESAWVSLVPSVVPILKAERADDRFVAAQALGHAGPAARAAVPDLLPMLQEAEHERNRVAAARALGRILEDAEPGDEVGTATRALVALFSDPSPEVRQEAVRACGMIGPAAAALCLPALEEPLTFNRRGGAADHPFQLVRRAAAWTAGRMGPAAAQYMDWLIVLTHVEGRNAPEVLEAIGRIGPAHENVAPNLVDFLERGGRDWRHYPESKMAAWKALEKFGAQAAPAVPLITRFLREGRGRGEPPELVRQWFAILRVAGPAAKEALPEVQKYAETATVPRGWQEWAETISRDAAETAAALSRIP